MQFINFMKIPLLPKLAADTQPWTTLWLSQPVEIPSGSQVEPDMYWAANIQYGNYTQVRDLQAYHWPRPCTVAHWHFVALRTRCIGIEFSTNTRNRPNNEVRVAQVVLLVQSLNFHCCPCFGTSTSMYQ
jgi:hypothetical protein